MDKNNKLVQAIQVLTDHVPKPETGLPDEVFDYISQTTPLVNVDLLIKDENERTLLAWRDDPYCGQGWHVPGGIVRLKESLQDRVIKVAENEIGTTVTFEPVPMAIHQFIHPERAVRSHFISILFKCFLPGKYVPENKGLTPRKPGYLMWHERCPHELLKFHEIYRSYI